MTHRGITRSYMARYDSSRIRYDDSLPPAPPIGIPEN